MFGSMYAYIISYNFSLSFYLFPEKLYYYYLLFSFTFFSLTVFVLFKIWLTNAFLVGLKEHKHIFSILFSELSSRKSTFWYLNRRVTLNFFMFYGRSSYCLTYSYCRIITNYPSNKLVERILNEIE